MDVKFSKKQNQIHYMKLFPFRLFILNKTQYYVLPKQNTFIINVTPNENVFVNGECQKRWTTVSIESSQKEQLEEMSLLIFLYR